jgi:hypothetical protein
MMLEADERPQKGNERSYFIFMGWQEAKRRDIILLKKYN